MARRSVPTSVPRYGRGSEALKPEILAKLPRLALVGVVGLSLTSMEPAALISRNIALVNAAEAYAQSLAEFALGLAILGRRRGFTSHEVMRLGGWGTSLPPAGLRGLIRQIARKGRPIAAALGLEERLLGWWRATLSPTAVDSFARHPQLLRGATVGLVGWGGSARAFTARLLQQRRAFWSSANTRRSRSCGTPARFPPRSVMCSRPRSFPCTGASPRLRVISWAPLNLRGCVREQCLSMLHVAR